MSQMLGKIVSDKGLVDFAARGFSKKKMYIILLYFMARTTYT